MTTNKEKTATVIIDGKRYAVEAARWMESVSPEIITRNGVELPPGTIHAWLCRFKVRSPGGARFDLCIDPPFENQARHLNPVAVSFVEPQEFQAGLSGNKTATLNAWVEFAEARGRETHCFVELLPAAKAETPPPALDAKRIEKLEAVVAQTRREAVDQLTSAFPDLCIDEIGAGIMNEKGVEWSIMMKRGKCSRGTLSKRIARFYEVTGFERVNRRHGMGKKLRLDEDRDQG